MLTRGGMLIASSSDPVATRDSVAATIRAILAGLAASPEASRQPLPGAAERAASRLWGQHLAQLHGPLANVQLAALWASTRRSCTGR